MEEETYYKSTLRTKGQITIPAPIREKLGIKEGDDLAFYIAEDGNVVVKPLQVIPLDQLWFWTERWQKMEHEAEADIEAGRTHRYRNIEDALSALNSEDE